MRPSCREGTPQEELRANRVILREFAAAAVPSADVAGDMTVKEADMTVEAAFPTDFAGEAVVNVASPADLAWNVTTRCGVPGRC